MSPLPRQAEVAEALGAVELPAAATVETTLLPSGAVDLVIRSGPHVASVQGTAAGQWGWSINWPAGEGLMGHDHAATSLQAALAGVAAHLAAESDS